MSAAALVLLLGVPGAGAQTLYKSTMPDGKVIYGERPVPGAKRVDKIEPPPAKTGMTALTPEEKARAEQSAKARAELQAKERAAAEAKRVDLGAARKALQEAEAARDKGKEPLPGERIGIVGGGTRLGEAYHARQKTLEQAVLAARKRVEEAQGR